MPTLPTMRIPPPKDGKEFEAITLSAIRVRWNSPNCDFNGRQGQEQAGVDLIGWDNLGRFVGVQCKATKDLSIALIKKEAEAANAFAPKLAALYFATILPHDAELQKAIRIYSEERLKEDKCPVGIMFWESILSDLMRDPNAFRLHYPDLVAAAGGDENRGSRLLAALDIGMLGTNLKYRMQLLFGEAGWLAQEDPHSFARVTLGLRSCGEVLFRGTACAEFVDLTEILLSSALRVALGKAAAGEDWDSVTAIATKVQAYVEALEPLLSGRELAAYTAGRLLARWDILAGDDKVLPKDLPEHIIESTSFLPERAFLAKAVEKGASDFRADKSISVVHIPGELYGTIRKAVRSFELRAN